jgi:DNA helicase-2/ATP-dependent DNA helicase PcrA
LKITRGGSHPERQRRISPQQRDSSAPPQNDGKPLASVSPLSPDAASDVLRGLNPAQKEAVAHGEGPLLVIAGAGTGKTTVLARRIASLINSKRAKPSEILALTFTDAAATEMETRVDLLVPYGFNDVQISTFHAFGDRLLKTYALEMGISPNFKILSSPESAVYLKGRLFDIPMKHFRPMGKPTQFVNALLSLCSRARDEDVTVEDYAAWAERKFKEAQTDAEREAADKQREMAGVYAHYEAAKRRDDLIDFGDQVTLALRLLRNHPSALERARSRFRYVLVDEFQDTNYAQFELVKLIAGGLRNLTVVADDDQSIYKWRGACLSNVLGFLDAYPEARQIVLTENYRSTQVILDAAYRLIIQNNPDRLEVRNKVDKRLRAKILSGPPVCHWPSEKLEDETERIAAWIADEIKEGRRRAKDVAILVRANNDAPDYLEALSAKNVPWIFSGDAGLYSKPDIQRLLSHLRAVADPFDSVSLYHLLASLPVDLPGEDLARLTHAAHRSKRPLWDVLTAPEFEADRAALAVSSGGRVSSFVENLRQAMERSKTLTTGQILYAHLKENGILAELSRSEAPQDVERAQNIAKFFETIREYGRISELDHVGGFVQHLEALMSSGNQTPGVEDMDSDAVRVFTLHKAKGLEFPVVFLVSLVEDGFPVRARADLCELPRELARELLPEGDHHLQEERRLFYVGMTRAKEELFLCAPRFTGGKRARKTSRFVAEALDVPRVDPKSIPVKPLDALKYFSREAAAAEKERPLPDGELVLRATAVEDYDLCPLKYKFSHVLRIPTERFHAATYGTAIHEALRFVSERRMAGLAVTAGQAQEVFKAHWVSEGFVSREHEEQRFHQGLETVERLTAQALADPHLPKSVEEDFRFKAGGAIVIGRWDRIDDRDGEIVIVDYKTTDVKTHEKAEEKTRDSVQLPLYALGYRSKYGRLPDAMELHFVESGFVGRVTPAEKKLEGAEAMVQTAAQGIRARFFPAKPGYMTCSFCPYQSICPSAVKTAGGFR